MYPVLPTAPTASEVGLDHSQSSGSREQQRPPAETAAKEGAASSASVAATPAKVPADDQTGARTSPLRQADTSPRRPSGGGRREATSPLGICPKRSQSGSPRSRDPTPLNNRLQNEIGELTSRLRLLETQQADISRAARPKESEEEKERETETKEKRENEEGQQRRQQDSATSELRDLRASVERLVALQQGASPRPAVPAVPHLPFAAKETGFLARSLSSAPPSPTSSVGGFKSTG